MHSDSTLRLRRKDPWCVCTNCETDVSEKCCRLPKVAS